MNAGAALGYAAAMKRSTLSTLLAVILGSGAVAMACGSGEGGGGGCRGDQEAWDAITAKPLDCQQNSDCCVVINACANQAQVVRFADFEAAEKAFPYCDDACTKCIPPSIQVACVNGKCVGEDTSGANATDEFRTSHCGMDATQVMTPATSAHFTCGG